MVPFADFQYFGLLLYVLLPFAVLGWFGRLSRNWMLLAFGILLALQSADNFIPLRPEFPVRELYLVLGYTVFQGCVAWSLLKWRSKPLFYVSIALSLLPLTASKLLPTLWPHSVFGFAGISYITFRSLDVLFSIQDGLIKELSLRGYAAFLLFVPALSSGPIDRYRRFLKDWEKTRSRDEFLSDLDFTVQRVAQGFLYKFIIAALIKSYWPDTALSRLESGGSSASGCPKTLTGPFCPETSGTFGIGGTFPSPSGSVTTSTCGSSWRPRRASGLRESIPPPSPAFF
jgi:membrane protein involved in D-alanine export